MKLLQTTFLSFLIIILAQACRENSPFEKSLDFAEENRGELEKVILHYSIEKKDSLKLEAAKFLITNMPIHFGYYDKTKKAPNIFSVIDTIGIVKGTLSNTQKAQIADSIRNIYKSDKIFAKEKIYDSKLLTADYLIDNIDYAFLAWKSAPWGKKVSFENFCENILPYRIREENAEHWRPAYYQRYFKTLKEQSKNVDAKPFFDHMNWMLNTETNFTVFFNQYYPFAQSVGDAEKGKIGGCETTSFIAATAMRSIGLPVAYDYIMHWGSSNSRHYMPGLVGNFTKPELLTNENKAESTWHLVDFSTEFNSNRHRFLPEEVPKELYIQNVRTIPKVYRYTYSQSAFLSKINKSIDQELISPEFRNTNLKDVTREYVTTVNIILPLDKNYEKYQLAYLCVFDLNGWQPIAISKLEDGRASFNNIGKQIMYIPTVYHDGAHWPVGSPFFVDSHKKMHKLNSNHIRTSAMTIFRKFPLYTYSAYHSEILKGGRFEASNDNTFSNPTLLHEINAYPFSVTSIKVQRNSQFRFIRYVAPNTADFEADNIAEIEFLDQKGEKISGKLIGTPGTESHEINKAFDGDLNTYYENSLIRDGWLGIDLGIGNKSEIGTIRYCPRTDTNFIMPGFQYELLYWTSSGWATLGVQTAKDYRLYYPKTPDNSLFWLRCLSGGTEERIFTYENNKQIWW